MASERELTRALFNKEPTEPPPTLDEFGMGGDYNGSLGDFVREHNALINAGDNVGLLPPDPVEEERNSIFEGGRQNLFSVDYGSPTRSPHAAFNEIYSNAWIKGGTQDPLKPQIEEAKVTTVQDELVETLINAYQDDEFTRQRLAKLHELPPQEQLDVLNFEIERRDAHKISAREALLIHVFRSGHSELSINAFDKVKRQFNPTELDQFRQQLRNQQTKELREEVDKVVARMDIGSTLQGIGDVLQQDFIPLWNVASRGLMANRALGAVDQDIGWFRSILPGEVRQEIREQFANSTPDQRIEYVRNIGDELEALKNGPYGALFTEYGVLENYIEIFSEDLLQENIPKNTLDRVLGNLDVVLEAAFGIGLLFAFGGRTTKQVFRTTNQIQARRLARAAGNHKLRAKLDAELGIVMREAGIDSSEAALVHMPKPPSLINDREVLPDPLKQQVEGAERVGEQILVNSDDLTGLGLTVDDKVNVVRKELNELDSYDTIVLNPQMSVLEALPNDTGFRYTAVYGATPNSGWSNLGDLLNDVADVLDETAEFKIMRRNADGQLEEVPRSEWPARARGVDVEEGYGLNNLSDEELLQLSKQVDRDSDAFKALEEEAMRRASGDREFVGDALRTYDGEDYYVELAHDRFWHTADKEALSPSTWRNGAGVLGKFLITPSMRFGDGIFASFDKAYRIEQATIRRFEQIYKPYYDLNSSDRKVVHKIMEWVEQTAKAEERMPDIARIMAEFDGVTQKQLGGVLSLNQGLNVQWELFNRRLYREWHTQGYKSAIPRAEGMAKYHGQVIERPRGSQTVYDPIAQKQIVMSADEIEDLYHEGGGLMKLDLAVDIPGEPGKASTLIRISNEDYKIGALSSEVLEYHPGYFSRFYEDPYFIIKRSGKEVDGRQTDLVEDAIRTAGSTEEADRFLRRFATFNRKTGLWVNNEDPSKSYRIQRAADLDNTESSLFTKQALNREGRLFWDKRNADRLPDVNGNRADLEDPVKALNRSTVMATRQTTHEDLMKTMKGAFEKEFKDLLPDVYPTQTINQTIRDLKSARRNAAEESLKQRYDQAIEFAEYIRLQQGTDEIITPFLREQAIRVASWISRMSGRAPSLTIQNAGFKFSRVLENTFQNMDPFRTMRSAAFNLYMVLRPARQVLLQGAQISFLTALDPLYVASGRVFKDGVLLRRGLMKLTKSNYEDGFNSKRAAKLMGLTQNQYKRLIQEVDRSGIIDTVDVHAFAGGAHRPKKSYDTPVLYTGKYLGKARQAMQTYGFDLGEQVNLANTFMVSLRRYMRENGIDDLMKLERSQWDEVAEDAMQLALGMTKPNKMWYQSGMVGTMTQFLTFSHRATLAMLGQNPALRKMDGFKIAMTGYLLFGSNMFGAGDWARSKLSAMGLDRFADKYIEGWGGTLVDLMAYGLIQNSFNAIMRTTMDEFKDLDLGFLAPGVNIIQLYEELLKGVAEAPWGTALGPFGNVARGFVEGIDFIARIRQGSELSNADKAMRSADYLMRGIAPQYNDAMTAYKYYKTGTWANRSGRVLPAEFEGNWLNALARASIGARSIEEMRFYYANNAILENEENFRSVIKGNRDFLIKNLNLYYNGELNKDFLLNQLDMLVAWSEDWPPHLRDEILRQSLITENEDGVSPITIIAEKAEQITPDIIAILDELPEVQGGDKEALREALEEIYNQRIENNEILIEELKKDDGRWLN